MIILAQLRKVGRWQAILCYFPELGLKNLLSRLGIDNCLRTVAGASEKHQNVKKIYISASGILNHVIIHCVCYR